MILPSDDLVLTDKSDRPHGLGMLFDAYRELVVLPDDDRLVPAARGNQTVATRVQAAQVLLMLYERPTWLLKSTSSDRWR